MAGVAVPLWAGRQGVAVAADGDSRRLAALLATAAHLTTRTADDALDLLEVLIATKPLAKAERETAKEKLKTLPKVERASATVAAALQVVLETMFEQVDTGNGEITPPKVDADGDVGADRQGGALRRAPPLVRTPTKPGGVGWWAASPPCGRSCRC